MHISLRPRMACHATFALFLIGLMVVWPTVADAVTAASYFLKIPPIEGDSTDATHPNEIVVLSFSLDFTQKGCGGLKVIKNIDKASPQLVLSAMLGTTFPSAILSGKTAGASQDFFNLRFADAVITAINIADSIGEPPAIETLTISASRVQIIFVAQNPDGSSSVQSSSIICR